MKIIELTQGYITVVSNEDFKKVNKYSWHVTRSGGKGRKKGEPYAATFINGKKIYLHRYIMGQPKGFVVDHLNQQTLDNRRENLRVCTQKENIQNRNIWRKEHRKK
jgi:hypothetical protein